MTFPGGAPLNLHFLSHAAQTWVPFLAAPLASYVLTNRKARFSGTVAIYGAFLIWSWGMVMFTQLRWSARHHLCDWLIRRLRRGPCPVSLAGLSGPILTDLVGFNDRSICIAGSKHGTKTSGHDFEFKNSCFLTGTQTPEFCPIDSRQAPIRDIQACRNMDSPFAGAAS